MAETPQSNKPDTISFTHHLKELRKRLLISIVAAVVGFGIAYAFSEYLYALLTGPLIPQLPDGSEFLAFTGIVEPFIVYLKVGFLGGVIIASPVILYEIWAFVAPGLYDKEKRWFAALVVVSVALFLSGVLFAYIVVFPFGFKYLLSYATEDLKPIITMNSYFSLVTRLLIAFGIIYQLPLGMLVAARLGVVTARKMLSWWRYAIVFIFAAAALITPTPDIFNQLLMAGPLVFLYGVGLVVASIFGKKKTEEEEPEEDEEDKSGGGDE
jgi:sec-independent protein translocase protein TatC